MKVDISDNTSIVGGVCVDLPSIKISKPTEDIFPKREYDISEISEVKVKDINGDVKTLLCE